MCCDQVNYLYAEGVNMVAIETHYLGPTNTKGSRYKAVAGTNQITVSAEYSLTCEANHRRAAEALCNKLNWSGGLIAGSTNKGYVFVFKP